MEAMRPFAWFVLFQARIALFELTLFTQILMKMTAFRMRPYRTHGGIRIQDTLYMWTDSTSKLDGIYI
ncbi:hypothetical protein GT037_004189 [Alternaria burnsii]|uniref:Uncharacterized protein n=1 Tax=Alternaria burnsii TaxID=1187904 RepID=A0A8H7B9Y2_9PLEO|nr:uncharacterized protein GT037_004189 [Alternaria burnsii]KAF7677330.1 hypothetical protein GT037_004189 [Alternaria burnsii]